MKNLFLILVLLNSLIHTSCSTREVIEPNPVQYTKETIAYNTIPGVNPNLLSLDLYYYEDNKDLRPVVIYVHGGAFAIGDKANSMNNKINLFSSLDYILISVNYRLSPTTLTEDPNRVMYPTHNNDVADAIDWIYNNVEFYGGDNQNMVLLGHSAGAHLVALTGTSNEFLPKKGIQLNMLKGVACFDTEGYNVVNQCLQNNEIYLNAFGYTDEYWTEASPIFNIFDGTTYPKFFIAKRGRDERIAISNAFINALKEKNAEVYQITANQYDHEGINDAIGREGETVVTEPLVAFLKECFE